MLQAHRSDAHGNVRLLMALLGEQWPCSATVGYQSHLGQSH